MKFPQCCLVLLFTPIAFAAENLYPEPGFEDGRSRHGPFG